MNVAAPRVPMRAETFIITRKSAIRRDPSLPTPSFLRVRRGGEGFPKGGFAGWAGGGRWSKFGGSGFQSRSGLIVGRAEKSGEVMDFFLFTIRTPRSRSSGGRLFWGGGGG